MKKIYITYGNFRYMGMFVNFMEACCKTLTTFIDKQDTNSFDINMPVNFICSEQGFNKHEIDLVISLSEIIEYRQTHKLGR